MKSSFLIYQDQKQLLDLLNDEQAGILFRCVFEYNCNGNEVREIEDPAVEMAFAAMKITLDRDAAKYDAIVERNRINGLRGGRPKKNPENPVGSLGNPENPEKPKKADSDSDSDSDSEKKPPKGIVYNKDFLKFWESYPNKTAKKTAYASWKKIDGKTLLPIMLKAIREQTAERMRKHERNEFCPEWANPATWINQARWEDEVQMVPIMANRKPDTGWKDKLNEWQQGAK